MTYVLEKSARIYKIEKKEFGLKLTFAETIEFDEMMNWFEDSKTHLYEQKKGFCVFVDMRTLLPLDQKTQAVMEMGQRLYREFGMIRSVVILDNIELTNQFKKIAKDSMIFKNERYIDISLIPNWEITGINWLLNQIEP